MIGWDKNYTPVEFAELKGKTITGIKTNEGCDEMRIQTTDGFKYIMMHEQECCESVYIEDVVGDLEDLIGNEIIQADEETSGENPEDKKRGPNEWGQDCFTWTFYKLGTNKGGVTIRWYGESNGYYSESVSLYRYRHNKELK